MRLDCVRIAMLLKPGEHGLTEVERLALESHLGNCEACRREALALGAVADLMDVASRPLGAAQRDQAIARALNHGLHDVPRIAPQVRRTVRIGWALGAACAATALWIAHLAREPHKGPTMPVIAGAARPSALSGLGGDRVASGEARAGDRSLLPGAPVPTATALSVEGGTTLLLGHARVTADAASELSWEPDRSSLSLGGGRVAIEVDPAPHRRFRVVTERFVVEVLGTIFQVDAEGVEVSRGLVHVLAPDDGRLLAELGAGQSWSVSQAAKLVPRRDDRGLPSAAESLARARAHLAAGAIAKADREITAALDAQPSPSQAAEAWTLRAECALVGGDPQRASALYVDVNRRYASLPAGETALFAAARIQVNAGQRSTAETLLRSYLARYPSGRFHAEANARLRALKEE